MAIPAVNLSYSGQGPGASGQVLAQTGVSGDATRALDAFGTATLDGTLTAFTANYIDGTATLPYTPSAIILSRSGKTSDTAAAGTAVTPSAVSNTGFTVNVSAAGSAAQLLSFAARIIK